MKVRATAVICLAAVTLLSAQQEQPRQVMQPPENQRPGGWPDASNQSDGNYVLKQGTRIPLTVLTTVSSKNAAPGDQVYLQTLIPVSDGGRIVIPAGSYVNGTITQAQRSGKVKGKGQLYLRFDSLMLPNGRTIDLNGRLGAIDGSNPGTLNRDEGKVTSDGQKGTDAMIVGGTAASGAAMGGWIGGQGRDAGIGAGAGAAAGLAGVLLTRGPDAVLQRGSTLDMVLNHDLVLTADDIAGAGTGQSFRPPNPGPSRQDGQNNRRTPMRTPGMGRGIPWP
jgi:type IV secretion system protein VirB10